MEKNAKYRVIKIYDCAMIKIWNSRSLITMYIRESD